MHKPTAQILLEEIETFLKTHGMAPSTFGLKACGDAHLIRYLKAGKSVTTKRLDQCRSFMKEYKPMTPKAGKENKAVAGNGVQ